MHTFDGAPGADCGTLVGRGRGWRGAVPEEKDAERGACVENVLECGTERMKLVVQHHNRREARRHQKRAVDADVEGMGARMSMGEAKRRAKREQ